MINFPIHIKITGSDHDDYLGLYEDGRYIRVHIEDKEDRKLFSLHFGKSDAYNDVGVEEHAKRLLKAHDQVNTKEFYERVLALEEYLNKFVDEWQDDLINRTPDQPKRDLTDIPKDKLDRQEKIEF